MACPDISMLIFSHSGEAAIRRIKQIQGAANALSSVLGGSVLLDIFVGNRVLGSANNIRKKDWEIWADAMRAVPSMVSREINIIAQEQLMHPLAMNEREFWEAVLDGCH